MKGYMIMLKIENPCNFEQFFFIFEKVYLSKSIISWFILVFFELASTPC